MSSDLDKLMGKLNKQKTPQETEEVEEIDDLDEDDQDDDEEIPTPAQKIKEVPKKEVKEVKKIEKVEDPEHSIEAEVGLLHNDGIFRRELLLTLKELVDVQKVQAELLIQLTKERKK